MTRPTFRRLLAVFGAPFLVASAALSQSAPPASVAASSDAERKAAASLDVFASQWMRKMERVEDDNRRKPQVVRSASSTEITYRGYTDDFKVELRPTGVPGAPFVGLIRYGEQLFSCSDPGATRCGVSHTTPVTEIFRFQNGRWIY